MEFKRWLEAKVSSQDVGEAMKRTLEMVVEGDWKFMGGERRRRLSETEHSRVHDIARFSGRPAGSPPLQ